MGLAHLLSVLFGEVANALADAVLIWAKVVLALIDLLSHLVAPMEGVRVTGDGGLRRDTAPRCEESGGRSMTALDLATAPRECIIGLLPTGGRFA